MSRISRRCRIRALIGVAIGTTILISLGCSLPGSKRREAADGPISAAIARKILERPESIEIHPLGETLEAIVRGADGIEELGAEVGDPPVTLNVLVVNPGDYGFDVTGSSQENSDGGWSFNLGISIAPQKWDQDAFDRLISPQTRKETARNGEVSLDPEEMITLIEHNAREGGEEVRAKSKTVFFLNGYGVPNRISLGWALILAKQGYQVIAPDLRGVARSGGKGPTYGHRDVEDLRQLLTLLQSKKRIGRSEPVAVIGVSYGAGIAALWAAHDPRVKASVLFAPYARADETMASAADTLKEHLRFPFVIDRESVRKGTDRAARKLGLDWEAVSPEKAIPIIRHPILFIASSSDEIIPASVVKQLHQSARKGSSLRSVNLPHQCVGLYLEELEPDLLAYLDRTLR